MRGNAEVGKILRQNRLRQRKSLRSVAKKIGISPAHLSRVERGQTGVGEPVLRTLTAELLAREPHALSRVQLLVEADRAKTPEELIGRVQEIGAELVTGKRDKLHQAVGQLFTEVAAVARSGDPEKVEAIVRVVQALAGDRTRDAR